MIGRQSVAALFHLRYVSFYLTGKGSGIYNLDGLR